MPAPSPINIKDSPKNREVMERAIRIIAKAFGKEDEWELFSKARERMLAAGDVRNKKLNAGDNSPNLEYDALADDYRKYMATGHWSDVGEAMAKVYVIGFEDGYSDCERAGI